MPRGKNKKKKKGQSSAAKGRNSNYGGNRNRGPHQSKKQEINDTLERASYLANAGLHSKSNHYEENYVDDHGYNNNRNGNFWQSTQHRQISMINVLLRTICNKDQIALDKLHVMLLILV